MSKSASVRTRKRGKTWSYIFEAGKTVEGKRKVIEKGGYPTKQAAYDAGVAAYTDWKHGNIGITSEKITVKDFIKNWLENFAALNVKPTSLQIYQSAARSQVIPYLGNMHLKELTPAVLDKWLQTLQKKGYSKNTLLQAHSFIHHVLDYAVYPSELISSNPAKYIKVPKKAPTNIIERHIISQEQLTALLEKYPFGTPYYIPIFILIHTGVRIGELLGLTWEDIDFDSKTIFLKRQVVYMNGQGDYLSTLKTESSYRYIVVGDSFLEELKLWRDQQLKNEQKRGNSYIYVYQSENGKVIQQSKMFSCPEGTRMDLICTRESGRMIQKKTLSKALKQSGLNAHSFRHTHATMLIENGAKPKGVAGRLGHADSSITQNLYTHNTRKLQEETAAILDNCLQTKPYCRQ